MDQDVEIPEYFICPISLQIMKDPVTVITGITYDRDSITHWQSNGQNKTCPVTKQPLPVNSPLTPNHMLRRLIQSWSNATSQSSKSTTTLTKLYLTHLLKGLGLPDLYLPTLRELQLLASDEGGVNRVVMEEAGVGQALVQVILSCHENGQPIGLKEALDVIHQIMIGSGSDHCFTTISSPNYDDRIIDSLMWVLGIEDKNHDSDVKSNAVALLQRFIEKVDSRSLERLKLDFFKKILSVLRQGIEILAALRVMLSSCRQWRRNCIMMVEAGAVYELVELELKVPEKVITELIMELLFHLCSCADGRAQLVSHSGGIAVITARVLKYSPKIDERAILILSMVSKFSGSQVAQEMIKVGTVGKLCLILQVERPAYLKDKVGEILRRHYLVWKDSPCVDSTNLTRYTR